MRWRKGIGWDMLGWMTGGGDGASRFGEVEMLQRCFFLGITGVRTVYCKVQ